MEVLHMPIYTFVFIKVLLMRLSFIKDYKEAIIIVSCLLTVIIAPLALIGFSIFVLYRSLIEWILKRIYGEDYLGIMEGIDSISCICVNCNPFLVALVDFDGELDELKTLLHDQIGQLMKTQHQRLFCLRASFLGYHYFYKYNLKPEDLISVMKHTGVGVMNKRQFSETLSVYDEKPMPMNDRALFQILLCPERIEVDGNKVVPIMYRVHHCVADGKSLLHLFSGVLADNKNGSIKAPQKPIQQVESRKIDVGRAVQFMKDVHIAELPFTQFDDNCLRGLNLVESKHFVWFAESQPVYLQKIKKLRKTLSGVAFLDIINTCLASSLHDHYQKSGKPMPKDVIGGIVLSPETSNSYMTYGSQEFTLQNRFTASGVRLPINIDGETGNKLLTRLRLVKRQYDAIKKAFDVQFSYWVTQNIVSSIPWPFSKWLAYKLQITVGISSLPGCDYFTFFKGHDVKEFILCPPNSPGTGLHIIIYTYGGNLKLSMSVDKSIIPNREDAQEIIDKIVYYVDELTKACEETTNIIL
ncbi:PREDICTED: uncharacterized protein LOC108563078 [Nicrophorus vespilloides]|uniref:Uncharacterized protein LOC108563078 n=1 Tax=Nicrophorus vespilloides TaxID=110193 RepID=A0ABM1MRE1_NICVS|nr:PREDICTED: uncharacterized protein LOC108563078 [Nicrophorus vespilloides]